MLQQLRWVLLACLATFASLRSAEARVENSPSTSRQIVTVDGRLRSAFLLRASGMDQRAPAKSHSERMARLQRHFAAVLAILVESSDASLEIALDRLQSHRGEEWTADERAGWWKRLATERMVNLQRLRRYAQRGVFPINEHVANRAVPVFVDNYDTACAVGHLMRESGWEEAVAGIVEANNFIYVTEAGDSSVADWALVSGLILEEAALIQPAYDPPPIEVTIQELVAGGSIAQGGVRYENFRFRGGPALFPEQTFPSFNTIDLQTIGAAAHEGRYTPSCCDLSNIDPEFEDWIYIQSQGMPMDGEHWRVHYQFDVVAEQPGMMISAASLHSAPGFALNWLNGQGGKIEVDTQIFQAGLPQTVYDTFWPNSPLALAHMHLAADAQVGGPFLFGEDIADFAPREKVTVATVIKITGPAQVNALVHSFAVIPEPTAACLAALGCALAPLGRRRLWARV